MQKSLYVHIILEIDKIICTMHFFFAILFVRYALVVVIFLYSFGSTRNELFVFLKLLFGLQWIRFVEGSASQQRSRIQR